VDWSKRLSPAQLEAATRLDAPVCVLAGAGSGKTRVITHRIAWLVLEKRVAPERILAVTFTNKAAGEMKQRIGHLVPGIGWKAQVGTFHGLAARMLRRWGRAVGLSPSFVIYDDDDWTRLLQRIVVNDLNLEKDATRGIASLIESWAAEGLGPRDVPKGHELLFEHALRAYELSRERLDQMGAIDFGGLLLKLRDLLRSEVGAYVKETVRHVLVDEYQDVNAVQAEIVLAFARAAESVAVVGDDDQAIYGWRGASASNLRRFLDTMPGAVLVKLEENYRSTATILEAANGIIQRNVVRLGKRLLPTGERGRAVRVVRARDDLEEARRTVHDVLEHARAGTSLDEIAVLYRTNALSRPFEDELRRASLPYRVVGGVRFYDRKEVKDVLATVRCAILPTSDVDTVRFLAAVPRGIGDATQKKLEEVARRRGLSLLLAMNDPAALDEAGLPERTQKKCLAVSGGVLSLGAKIRRQSVAAEDPAQGSLFAAPTPPIAQPGESGEESAAHGPLGAKDAIALAVELSGVADRLQAEATVEAEGRLENLEQLLSAAAEWAEQAREAGEPDDVVGFLESASLLSSVDESRDGRGQVTLMTLHAAKGLEFEVVYLAGLEEHGFPHARSLAEGVGGDALEEERRLAYVGITRARRRLVLSYADWRMIQGQRKRRTPSRFLHEIPREVLDGDIPSRSLDRLDIWRQRSLEEPRPGPGGSRVVYDHEGLLPRARLVMTDAELIPDADIAASFTAPEPGRPAPRLWRSTESVEGESAGAAAAGAPPEGDSHALDAGARVWHRLFGSGTVVGMRGSGRSAAALVRFDEERQPRVIIARHLRSEEAS
jgi:DNA helicase II / ATP-dependent DNA helicase PcrA